MKISAKEKLEMNGIIAELDEARVLFELGGSGTLLKKWSGRSSDTRLIHPTCVRNQGGEKKDRR